METIETMNVRQDFPPNDDIEISSCADTNANVNDTSRGAIPKKPKVPLTKKTCKKPAKLNNNIENMSTLNIDETQKINGITNGLSGSYLEDFIEPSCSSHKTCFYESKEDSTDTEELSGCSDETELLSVSEDGCIYTYKGDNVADLPNSFFELPPDIPENRENEVSSPEMDYLEMDFDPSNNGDIDSSSEADANEVNPLDSNNMDMDATVEIQNSIYEPDQNMPTTSSSSTQDRLPVDVKANGEHDREMIEEVNTHETSGPSNRDELMTNSDERSESPAGNQHNADRMPWSCSLEDRTISLNLRATKRLHYNRGDLVSPSENSPPIKSSASHEDPEAMMIWTQEEAYLKQITQIGPSSCGATAVLNVLKALRLPLPSVDKITNDCVRTQLRKNDAPLCEYLLSRSAAGSTHKDIIDGLHKASSGAVYSRFFHMYPERVINLCTWLKFWIEKGAVPIATLNLQRCIGTIPDAWHHQMIHGVDVNGIYLTNPLECVEAGLLWPQLCSESVLLVRRTDVLSRWNIDTDLPELMRINDTRWQRINVVGQVANMVHESSRELRPGFTNTSHIRIPAAYSSGITLVTTVNSPACLLLKQSPELPLLDSHIATSVGH